MDTLGQLPRLSTQLPTADRRLRIPSHHIHNFQEQDPNLIGSATIVEKAKQNPSDN
ncbi:MAG: hypothetical protein WCD70_04295 [Alphaproteobacteria bacterium]